MCLKCEGLLKSGDSGGTAFPLAGSVYVSSSWDAAVQLLKAGEF